MKKLFHVLRKMPMNWQTIFNKQGWTCANLGSTQLIFLSLHSIILFNKMRSSSKFRIRASYIGTEYKNYLGAYECVIFKSDGLDLWTAVGKDIIFVK